MKRSGTCHNFSRDYAVWPGSGQKRLPSSRLFSDAGLATRPLISHLSLLTAYCLLLTAYRLPLTVFTQRRHGRRPFWPGELAK